MLSSCVHSLNHLVEAVSEQPVLLELVPRIATWIQNAIPNEDLIDLYESVLELLHDIAYYPPQMSPQVFDLLPLCFAAFDKFAVDFLPHFYKVFDTFVTKVIHASALPSRPSRSLGFAAAQAPAFMLANDARAVRVMAGLCFVSARRRTAWRARRPLLTRLAAHSGQRELLRLAALRGVQDSHVSPRQPQRPR